MMKVYTCTGDRGELSVYSVRRLKRVGHDTEYMHPGVMPIWAYTVYRAAYTVADIAMRVQDIAARRCNIS